MNKFSIGFSILSTLLIGAGCTDEASIVDAEPTGEAVFSLITGNFSLAGTITLTEIGGDATVFGPEVIVQGDATLTVGPLPVGSYTPTLPTWELFQDPDGPALPLLPASIGASGDADDFVTFSAFTPTPVVITDGGITGVTIGFLIGEAAVVFSEPPPVEEGTASFIITQTANTDCGNCVEPESCVSIEGEPSCERVCTVPGANVQCESAGFTGICLDGDAVNICDRNPT